MALELKTTIAIPNAVYVANVNFQTGINNGKPITACQITFAAARVENEGTPEETWEQSGMTRMVHLPDLFKPEADLEKYSVAIGELYTKLLSLAESINDTRKVL